MKSELVEEDLIARGGGRAEVAPAPRYGMRGVPGHLAGTACASLRNAGGFVSISRTRGGRRLVGMAKRHRGEGVFEMACWAGVLLLE